jgi:4-diphosphocytidyl-2-C-methyl-D-erythritol kinase
MLVRKLDSAWETLAPAKLNLYLEVLARRPDGFHELETLMAPIRVYDWLRWEPHGTGDRAGFALQYHPATPGDFRAAAPADANNLVVRAAAALGRAAGIEPWGRLTLLKRIAPQAGLGGGSSDAAGTLMLVNEAWGIHYPQPRLMEIASELGSDVPFFLAGQTAICRGRGEQVERVANMPRLEVVVVKPPIGLATAEVYKNLGASAVFARPGSADRSAPARTKAVELCVSLRRGAMARAKELMTNGLQRPAARMCAWIDEIGAVFDRLSCYGHLMTGSGSAYFGVMRTARHARRAASMLSSRNLGTVFATATRR